MKGVAIDWRLALSIAIPGVIVIAGWFFVHWLNARRDLAARKREARVNGLEAAYLRVAKTSNQPQHTHEMMDEFELFISEIQLYGTQRQVELMGQVVEGFKVPNNRVNFDPLLKSLRDELRRELELEPIAGEVWWLRFGRSEKKQRFRITRTGKG